MKKITTILFLVTATIAKSQIQVGMDYIHIAGRSGKISPEKFEKLRSLFTTVFVLQTGDSLRKDEFENAISQVWTVNKFMVILPSEMKQYENRTDCIIACFEAEFISDNIGYFEAEFTSDSKRYFYYILKYPLLDKKGKIDNWETFGKLILKPNDEYLKLLYPKTKENAVISFRGSISLQELTELAYSKVFFKNWSPGFLKGYLKRINDLMESGNNCDYYDKLIKLDVLKELKGDTLYIPKYILEDNEKIDEGNLPFTLVYSEQDDFDSIILNRKKKFFYSSIIITGGLKIVSIFEGSTGNMVYSKSYMGINSNFKKKDLEKIAEVIVK